MNIALIGLGKMGKNHLNELSKKTDVNVFAYDLVRATELKNAIFFDNLDELLERKIDGAIIATPTAFHFEIFQKIHKKIKNILIEKPLCSTLEEANNIKSLATSNNVCIGFCERFNPVSLEFKKISENEKIIYANFIRASSQPERVLDVGVDLDLSVHDIDLANFFGIKNDDLKKIKNEKTEIILSSKSTQFLASWQFHTRIRKALINTTKSTYELDFLNLSLSKDGKLYKTSNFSNLAKEHDEFFRLIKSGDFGYLATLDDAIFVQNILQNQG